MSRIIPLEVYPPGINKADVDALDRQTINPISTVIIFNPGKIPQSTTQYLVQELSRIRGLYRLFVRSGVNDYIVQTGANVTTYVILPTECLIKRINWTHATSALTVLSADALTITIDSYCNRGRTYAPLRWLSYTGAASNDIEAYDFIEPANEFLITSNTTATDVLFLSFDIEIRGDNK